MSEQHLFGDNAFPTATYSGEMIEATDSNWEWPRFVNGYLWMLKRRVFRRNVQVNNNNGECANNGEKYSLSMSDFDIENLSDLS